MSKTREFKWDEGFEKKRTSLYDLYDLNNLTAEVFTKHLEAATKFLNEGNYYYYDLSYDWLIRSNPDFRLPQMTEEFRKSSAILLAYIPQFALSKQQHESLIQYHNLAAIYFTWMGSLNKPMGLFDDIAFLNRADLEKNKANYYFQQLKHLPEDGFRPQI